MLPNSSCLIASRFDRNNMTTKGSTIIPRAQINNYCLMNIIIIIIIIIIIDNFTLTICFSFNGRIDFLLYCYLKLTARGEGIVTELLTDVSREKARHIESIYQIKANKIRCRNHKKYRNLSSVQHFGLGPRGLGPSTGSVLCSVHSAHITTNIQIY